MPPTSFRWSLHAIFEAQRRGVSFETVERVVCYAQQVVKLDARREVRQSMDSSDTLVRVIVDVEQDPVVIVTVYRTSKVVKYWRPSR
jgi:ABC-type phosphate transport system auxiliary subunit